MTDKKHPGIVDLIRKKTRCYFEKGDRMIEQGKKPDCIFFLEKGTAKVVHKNARGKEFNFLQVHPGDYLGIHPLINKERAFASVIANEPLTAMRITEENLHLAMEEHAEISLEVMKQLCTKIGLVEARIAKLSRKSIKEQIADILLTGKKINAVPFNGSFYTIPELADLVGTTHNYIYKILGELQQRDVLTVKNKNIQILDKHKLRLYTAGNH